MLLIDATCAAMGCVEPTRLSTRMVSLYCDGRKHHPFSSIFSPSPPTGELMKADRCPLSDRCIRMGCEGRGEFEGLCSIHDRVCRMDGCLGQRCQDLPVCTFHAAGRAAHNMIPALRRAPLPPHPHPPRTGHQCDVYCSEHRHSNKLSHPDSFCQISGCQRLRRIKEGGQSEWCDNRE
ncbi:hypothetical protein IF1G_06475 [Cordyceps javanica]|uniref:Uncharacterized protein n=1 Tax=Cordyceps javanica TaxID=43265 RepID=A0A545UYA4_9HYPO|nr:hypothetical protein IF1G_06475 [Cordyceps javanica]